MSMTLLFGDLASTRLNGATVFVDHEPALVGAAAILPSGQVRHAFRGYGGCSLSDVET